MAFKFSTRFPYIKKRKSCPSSGDIPIQRIIIPQGLVNPHELTIIEIPQDLQDVAAVIAKANDDESYSDFSPITCSSVLDSQLFPKDSNASASLDPSQYSFSARTSCGSAQIPRRPCRTIPPKSKSFPRTGHPQMPFMYEEGVTYGGMGYDFTPGSLYKDLQRPCGKTSAPIDPKSKSFPRTGHPQMPYMYEEGVTYGGMGYDFTPNRSGTFYKGLQRPCGNSNSTSAPIIADVDPKSKSFPRTAQPHMAEMYDGGVTYGGMGYDFSPNYSGTFYKDYIQNYTSIIGPHNESEETGYNYSDPARRARGFDPYTHGEALKKQFSQYMDFEPPACSTPTGYQQSADSYLNALDYTVPELCEPSYLVPRAPPNPYTTRRDLQGRTESRITSSGLKKVLDNLDIVELSRIQHDLTNFQLARRQLLFDATNLKH